MATTRAMEKGPKFPSTPAESFCDVYAPTPFLGGPRHDYLAKCVPDVNPRILARSVDRAMVCLDPCMRHREPRESVLHENTPNIYAPTPDASNAEDLFGHRPLPKLLRDLDRKDREHVRRALVTIADLMHDSNRVTEAVRENLTGKMVELMLNEDPMIRELSFTIVNSMVNRVIGYDAFVKEPNAIATLKRALYDSVPSVRLSAAMTMATLARFRKGAYDLDEGDLSPHLVQVLSWEREPKILGVLAKTLRHMLELNSTRETCIAHGAFAVLRGLITKESNVEMIGGALECLFRLSTSKRGKDMADLCGILTMPEIHQLLASKNPIVCSETIMMMMSMTHTNRGKKLAYDAELLKPLLELAKRKSNRRAQLCSLQTLTNLCEYMPCRTYLLKREDDITKIDVADEDVDEVRKRLLREMFWKP